MVIPTNRKTIMTLYSGDMCIESHVCRIVLVEKGVECQIQYLKTDSDHQELAELNPYNEAPALIDRELVLYSADVINEYLDERLPHPPLMPIDPVSRGRSRLMIMRLRRDWIQAVKRVEAGEKLNAADRRTLRDGLIAISPLFREQPFMMGADFSLVDCYMAPFMWRLPWLGIKLPKQAEPIEKYAERLFERASIRESLSPAERELR